MSPVITQQPGFPAVRVASAGPLPQGEGDVCHAVADVPQERQKRPFVPRPAAERVPHRRARRPGGMRLR